MVLLVIDLAVFHRDNREPTLRESSMWTVVWCSIALAFNGLVWYWRGPKPAIDFLSGYIVEWSLSMDNVFVFAVIFTFFRVPFKYQYRVLVLGHHWRDRDAVGFHTDGRCAARSSSIGSCRFLACS